MRKYFRIVLGKNHAYADESIKGNFIGVDLDSDMDSPALYLMQFKSTKV